MDRSEDSTRTELEEIVAELTAARADLTRRRGPLGRLLGLADWSTVDAALALGGVRERLDALVDRLLGGGARAVAGAPGLWATLDALYCELFDPTLRAPPAWLLRERIERALGTLGRVLDAPADPAPAAAEPWLALPAVARTEPPRVPAPIQWAFPRLGLGAG